MALIKGINGKCPCPICLVPNEEFARLLKNHERRSASQGQAVMGDITLRQSQRATRLKAIGLRAIKVVPRLALLCLQSEAHHMNLHRMLSGRSKTPTRMMHLHSTVSISTTRVFLASIYGLNFRKSQKRWAVIHCGRSTVSTWIFYI